MSMFMPSWTLTEIYPDKIKNHKDGSGKIIGGVNVLGGARVILVTVLGGGEKRDQVLTDFNQLCYFFFVER